MIKIDNFTKKYGKRIAVEDFSILCEKGSITALLGANGAGKTTILKAVCARHFASAGKIEVCGVDAAEDAEKVRLLTGFVEEEPILPKDFLVSEYVSICAKIKMTEPDAIEKVKSRCSLSEIWHEKIANLSKGQRERVNFAQALVNDPPVLVLDEPASGLDPAQIVKMRSLVKSIKKNRTIILSTHLMQEVDALCDKICVISHGKNVAFGTASQIILKTNTKNLEEAFFKLSQE